MIKTVSLRIERNLMWYESKTYALVHQIHLDTHRLLKLQNHSSTTECDKTLQMNSNNKTMLKCDPWKTPN